MPMPKSLPIQAGFGFFQAFPGVAEGGLAGAADLVGPDAAGADGHGFVLTVGQNHLAFLQVGVLEKPVMLVGEANFVGFVAVLAADFASTGHWRDSFCLKKSLMVVRFTFKH
jgi:hypothetical protein